MALITLGGNPIHTLGVLPEVGSILSDFKLIQTDLSVATLETFKGKRLVFNIFPSIDTGTCAASVRKFNEVAANLKNTTVVCVSRDLPFAQKRFCGAEGIDNVINLSDFKEGIFGKDNGLEMIDGPLSGLHSRALIITDAQGTILYTEQVGEIADEPNYEAALAVL
jgi:thiol peroxidase